MRSNEDAKIKTLKVNNMPDNQRKKIAITLAQAPPGPKPFNLDDVENLRATLQTLPFGHPVILFGKSGVVSEIPVRQNLNSLPPEIGRAHV